MDLTDQDVANVRRITEQLFEGEENIEIVKVKQTGDDVMASVSTVDTDTFPTARNAFATKNLKTYHENGYVAVSVGGGNERHSAWFERADAVEFGDAGPSGEYDLGGDWCAVVGDDRVVLQYDGETAAHVARDGWKLNARTVNGNIPHGVAQSLYDIGFDTAEGVEFDSESI